jgi:DNA-binding MarR family transcriptional regulator
MKQEFPASIVQINYLFPLKKWRILDLRTLLKKSLYENSYDAFTKMLLRLEKKNLIDSFIDPFTKNKFIYLTKEGDQYIGDKEHSPAMAPQSLIHDSKVTKLAIILLELSNFIDCELEHEKQIQGGFKMQNKIIPDATIHGQKNGQKFKVAFELELTRKSKGRYLTKVQSYLSSSYYDFIIYYFHSKNIMESYKKTIEEKCGDTSNRKIIYAYNENLLLKGFNFDNSTVIYKNKKCSFKDLFDQP